MTGIYDPPAGSRPPWAPPDGPYGGQPGQPPYGQPPYGAQQPYGWPGHGGSGGPYDPYGYGRGGPNGPFRRLRRQLLALVAVVVIAVASFWGLESARSHQSGGAPTTRTIAGKVDGGL
ncbi:MAG TPA: hypothetical protein VFW16_15610, partial [Streptosporangiaceae bacterium]|nr:hypothetical protein [Streptosporangiaceae bacterium]